MKKIVRSFILFVSLTVNSLVAEIGYLPEFKSVVPVTGGIQLASWDHGGRFNYQIAEEERKIQNYNEDIVILDKQVAEFATKHVILNFTPVVGNPGAFTIKRICDMRSMGGPRTQESFVLSIDTGKVIYSEKIVTILDK
jgi:hypothetical protein